MTSELKISGATVSADEPRPAPRTNLLISLLVGAAFVVILNETIMGVALPNLMVDLQITAASAQWLTTAYLLTMAIVIPLTGYLLERFPLRRVYMAAMTLFTIGTLIAALAPGFGVLLTGRIVQASGTAVMLPLLFTTVLTLVPPAHRGRMMGVISIVIAVAPAIGPTVSGLILATLDWRWIFWLVLPLALLALVLGAIWVRNVTETDDVRFDVLSVILSAFAFGGLIFGLSSIGEAAAGHAIVPVWIPLVGGTVALIAFILRQLKLQRTDSALLDLRTFRYRSFSISVGLVAILMASLFGSLTLLPIYLQSGLGVDTLTVGLMLLPGGILMGAIAPVVGSLFDRFGPTPLVIPGMIIVAGALWGMTTFDAATSTRVDRRCARDAEPRSRPPLHPAVHIGARLVAATPVLTRERDHGHPSAGRWSGRHGTVRHDHDGDRRLVGPDRRGWVSRHRRGGAQRLPRRRDRGLSRGAACLFGQEACGHVSGG